MIGWLRETKNAGGNEKQRYITMYISLDASHLLHSGLRAISALFPQNQCVESRLSKWVNSKYEYISI